MLFIKYVHVIHAIYILTHIIGFNTLRGVGLLYKLLTLQNYFSFNGILTMGMLKCCFEIF